ncbi:MAG: DUF4176 domain-containing protein [Coprococcus phoceensis]
MKKYKPLGSVVLLKNGTKRVMIYGRKQILASTGELFDYVTCLYPEGNIGAEYTFLFNDDDIEEVIFEGYSDKEDLEFIKKFGEEND